MIKILSTVGPVSSGRELPFLIKKSDILRFNASHNTISWHKKIINKIKSIFPNKIILVDIPGVKPRTLNKKDIYIKKGQLVKFSYNSSKKNLINISNPLPKIQKSKNKIKFFSISDGSYIFRLKFIKKNTLAGISLQSFILKPKKGLNLPNSIYDNNLQKKMYSKFISKISKIKYDSIGLSYIQDSKVIKYVKNKLPDKIIVSKIENLEGYLNRKEIISESDIIMIDRGDLSAEIGVNKLTEYVNQIVHDAKILNKPIILATENFNSLINNTSPSKSDVTNLDYYLSKNIDIIMLSDETATSLNWKNTISWVRNYIDLFQKHTKKNKRSEGVALGELIKKLQNQALVIFSKKGYFYEKNQLINNNKCFLFTEDEKLIKTSFFDQNTTSIHVKFPKKNLTKFLYRNIKKYKKVIFQNNEIAYLINVFFPRKNSRANSLIILNKKDFS